ncbi:MAG: hypothetical protein R2784_06675 [Saprospiraceae bacterium]
MIGIQHWIIFKSPGDFQEEEDKKGEVEVLNGFGDVYRRQKNFSAALNYTKQFLNLALEINDKRFEQSAYKDLSKIYAETGDFKNAYEYRKKYDEPDTNSWTNNAQRFYTKTNPVR